MPIRFGPFDVYKETKRKLGLSLPVLLVVLTEFGLYLGQVNPLRSTRGPSQKAPFGTRVGGIFSYFLFGWGVLWTFGGNMGNIRPSKDCFFSLKNRRGQDSYYFNVVCTVRPQAQAPYLPEQIHCLVFSSPFAGFLSPLEARSRLPGNSVGCWGGDFTYERRRISTERLPRV